jgi:hypothetical protein
LASYGVDKFYDAFLRNAQGAESRCVHCNAPIYLDIVEGGGIPDWGTREEGSVGGDYGCQSSPDSDGDGCGGHEPRKYK